MAKTSQASCCNDCKEKEFSALYESNVINLEYGAEVLKGVRRGSASAGAMLGAGLGAIGGGIHGAASQDGTFLKGAAIGGAIGAGAGGAAGVGVGQLLRRNILKNPEALKAMREAREMMGK